MMSRNDYAKRIRHLEIFSSLFMIIGTLVTLYLGFGLYALLLILVIYVITQVVNYRLMKKCRCPKCGNVDVFTKHLGFTTGVKEQCPNCHCQLHPDQKMPIKK